MRALIAALVLAASFLAAHPARAELPNNLTPMIICSPVVGGSWRAAVIVYPSWTRSDCVALSTSVGAGARTGCAFSRPPLGTTVRFTWGSDCLPGSTPGAPAPTATAQSAKLCSPLVPNNWRSITQVLSTWTPADCAAFANSVGASHFQLGCLHDAPVAGQRFRWERPVRVTATSFPSPVTSCGWGSSEFSATGAVLVCSPLVGGRWRSAMAVPRGWRARDCHAFARTVGASEFQLGCVFAVPPPSGSGLRFNWASSVGIAARFGAESLPPQNCGWVV